MGVYLRFINATHLLCGPGPGRALARPIEQMGCISKPISKDDVIYENIRGY